MSTILHSNPTLACVPAWNVLQPSPDATFNLA